MASKPQAKKPVPTASKESKEIKTPPLPSKKQSASNHNNASKLILSKSDLVIYVAARNGLSKSVVDQSLEAILEVFEQTLNQGGEIRLLGFGTFYAQNMKARIGRNPRTGEALKISAKKRATFRAGKELKEKLNKK